MNEPHAHAHHVAGRKRDEAWQTNYTSFENVIGQNNMQQYLFEKRDERTTCACAPRCSKKTWWSMTDKFYLCQSHNFGFYYNTKDDLIYTKNDSKNVRVIILALLS